MRFFVSFLFHFAEFPVAYLPVHDRTMPACVDLLLFLVQRACNTKMPPRHRPDTRRGDYGTESGDRLRRMARSGILWLAKVSATTALLAVVGIYGEPAAMAPMEPQGGAQHWSARG